jgi:hypothetical protein
MWDIGKTLWRRTSFRIGEQIIQQKEDYIEPHQELNFI